MNKVFFYVMIVVSLLQSCDQNYPSKVEMFFNVSPKEITYLTIFVNNKKSIETDTIHIQQFFRYVNGCSVPIEMRNLRVIDRYKVEFEKDSLQYVYHFYKKDGMPFIMSLWSRGENGYLIGTYKCSGIKGFLDSYK